MDTNERLERWIEQTVFSGVSDNITSLVLFHANVKRGDRLLKIDLSPDINATDIVVKIIATAEDDAMGLGGGTQRYIVRAQNKREKLVGRFAFVIQGEDDEEEGGSIDSEPATGTGLVKQAMRHLEASERTHILATNSIIATQARIIQRQQEHIENLEQRHLDQLDAHARIVMQDRQAELDTTTAAMAETRKDMVVKEFLPLGSMVASMVINKYLGDGKPLSQSQDPIMRAFVTFVKSLEPNEMGGMLAALPPMKRAAVMQLLKQIADEEDAKEKKEESK